MLLLILAGVQQYTGHYYVTADVQTALISLCAVFIPQDELHV
jgi:hypothetical protein